MVESLLNLVDFLNENKIEYCVIGGLAMMLHHGRANTVDIDVYVLADNLEDIFKKFSDHKIPIQKAGDYQLKAQFEKAPVDILWADPYIGADVVVRAVPRLLGEKIVRIATPEDLIVLKTMANRSVDRRDIEELRELFGKNLDEDYIQKKIAKTDALVK